MIHQGRSLYCVYFAFTWTFAKVDNDICLQRMLNIKLLCNLTVKAFTEGCLEGREVLENVGPGLKARQDLEDVTVYPFSFSMEFEVFHQKFPINMFA